MDNFDYSLIIYFLDADSKLVRILSNGHATPLDALTYCYSRYGEIDVLQYVITKFEKNDLENSSAGSSVDTPSGSDIQEEEG